MTGNKMSERSALDRLADALVEDILEMSDEELIEEIGDLQEVQRIATDTQSLFENSVIATGKARLAAAKTAVTANQLERSATVVALDPSAARRRIDRALASDPETQRKLTLAARKGEGLSDSDIQGMLEDLAELGVLPDDGGDVGA